MPELPEVHTTVKGLSERVLGLTIRDVWTDYKSTAHKDKNDIKNRVYFEKEFRPAVLKKRILNARRMAKNILIDITGGETILIHLKMTGHLLYGKYVQKEKLWETVEEGPLQDPFNQHIHLVFTLSNGKQLVLSDVRKFAKVMLVSTSDISDDPNLKFLGPEPLSASFTYSVFDSCLNKRHRGKIKQVLMEQSIISGIGNIYSDEILWTAGVNPKKLVEGIPPEKRKLIFRAIKNTLKEGIRRGGDSLSDYRNISGEKGGYQNFHRAYRQTGKHCSRAGCDGKIVKTTVGGRSAHFCDKHQNL